MVTITRNVNAPQFTANQYRTPTAISEKLGLGEPVVKVSATDADIGVCTSNFSDVVRCF